MSDAAWDIVAPSSVPTFSAVVLAAGLSSRMQGPHKLLLPVDGQPAVRRTVQALAEAGPEEIVVVTGFNGRAVMEALDGLRVTFQSNPRYREGQMTSVAAGVAALNAPCNVVMICLADQVLLTAADYRELIDAFAAMPRGAILIPMFDGQRGNPVAFAASYAAEVISGHVNPGCRKLIAEHPEEVFVHEAAHDRFTTDMDTPEDYAHVLDRLGVVHDKMCFAAGATQSTTNEVPTHERTSASPVFPSTGEFSAGP